jgi:integrase
MARLSNRLEAAFVAKATNPGKYPDGHGLYLLVGKSGAKSWFFRYKVGRKSTDMGLGPLHTVSLAEARRKALACRKQRLDSLDPLAERRRTQQQALESVTFEWCARQYVLAHRAGWKGGGKSAEQWTASLTAYVFPVLGRLPVQIIDTGLVMRVLDPIWLTKTETASRVRQRIENILDWATARGYRRGDNPARWGGLLENLLASPSDIRKVKPVKPHAALPADEIPAFLAALRDRHGISAHALEFTVLTAARSGEVLNAGWDEVDVAERMWTVPAGRMKGGVEHRTPLSPQAIAVLEQMAEVRQGKYIFPGLSPGRPLSPTAMRAVLEVMARTDLSIHGFRASFRTWAAERTNFAPEIAEAALAHRVGSATERAYRRGDFFNKRRRLMEAWGAFCTTPKPQSGEVTVIRAA